MITAPERCEEQTISEPRIRARGHLRLVDWEETANDPTAPSSKKTKALVRRSRMDRLYENSIIVLLMVIVIAVIASLTHL